MLGPVPFGGVPAILIELWIPHLTIQEIQSCLIVALFAALPLFKMLSSDQKSLKAEIVVSVTDIPPTLQPEYETMLDCLRDIRGVSGSTVTGLSPSTLNIEIAKLMVTPIEHSQELIARIPSYQKRGDILVSQGRLTLAQNVYHSGYLYARWAFEIFGPTKLPTTSRSELLELRAKMYDLLAECAYGHVRAQNPKAALRKLQDVLRAHLLPPAQKARAYFYTGLAFVILGEEHHALTSFLATLYCQPGYVGVDKAIDELLVRFDRSVDCDFLPPRMDLRKFVGDYRRTVPNSQSRSLLVTIMAGELRRHRVSLH